MLAQRVTSLAVWTGALQLISCRLIGYFLHVCLCLCCFPLTMPRGYRLLRICAQNKSCCCSSIVWQTSKNSWWIESDLHIIPCFWRLNGKCQGWSRGRGRREWANWFNKHRTDRWCRETETQNKGNKKVIRARRPTSEGKNGRESPGEMLLCTRVLRSVIQKTSSNTTGIATDDNLQMLETVIITICHQISWLESKSAALTEVKKLWVRRKNSLIAMHILEIHDDNVELNRLHTVCTDL